MRSQYMRTHVDPQSARQPFLQVIHTSRRPTPALPVDYSWFLEVGLPADFSAADFARQLEIVAQVVRAHPRRAFSAFGFLLGYALHLGTSETLYLDPTGSFAPWSAESPLPVRSEAPAIPKTMSKRKTSTKQPGKRQQYVIGASADGFYAIQAKGVGADPVDPSELHAALTFDLLEEAVAATSERGGSVFEVTDDGEQPLRELMVDLRKVNSAPYQGCYRIGAQVVVGPRFVTDDFEETEARIAALSRAKVTAVVALLERSEIFSMRRDITHLRYDEHFDLSYFPVVDGQAPSKALMKKILDRIDEVITSGGKVFVHCWGGRGRSGCVAGCALARHGIATGVSALNWLTEARYMHGLFSRSPETSAQRDMVAGWKEGE